MVFNEFNNEFKFLWAWFCGVFQFQMLVVMTKLWYWPQLSDYTILSYKMTLLLVQAFCMYQSKYNLPSPMKLWFHWKFSNHHNPYWVYSSLVIIRIFTIQMSRLKIHCHCHIFLNLFLPTGCGFSVKLYRPPTLSMLHSAGISGKCAKGGGHQSWGAAYVTMSNGVSKSRPSVNL